MDVGVLGYPPTYSTFTSKMTYEYRMKPNGETFSIKKGDCPPMDSIFIGEGDDEKAPQFSKEEQYTALTTAVNYDKQLYF